MIWVIIDLYPFLNELKSSFIHLIVHEHEKIYVNVISTDGSMAVRSHKFAT